MLMVDDKFYSLSVLLKNVHNISVLIGCRVTRVASADKQVYNTNCCPDMIIYPVTDYWRLVIKFGIERYTADGMYVVPTQEFFL